MKDEAIKRRQKEAEHCPLGGEAGATLAVGRGSGQGSAAKGAFGHAWGILLSQCWRSVYVRMWGGPRRALCAL